MAGKKKPRKKVGRPTRLNETSAKAVLEAIRIGNTVRVAASFAGVSEGTVHEWRARGARTGRGPFWEFSEAFKRAVVEWEARSVQLIANAGTQDWKAAAFLLERRNPAEWSASTKIRVETDKQIGAVLDELQEKLSPEAYRDVLAALQGTAAATADGATGEAAVGDEVRH